ncbi:MAG: site-2 protease family protein, partial [Culicoidibacterales bacterium]
MDLFLLLIFFVFYLTLYFLIVIHELGHLWIAKSTNVLCRNFIIGIGPKLFSFHLGETEYQFCLFPIAGGVEMAGEDGSDFDDAQGKRAFVVLNRAKKVTKLYINPETTMKDVNQIEGEIIYFYLRGSMRLRLLTSDGKRRT